MVTTKLYYIEIHNLSLEEAADLQLVIQNQRRGYMVAVRKHREGWNQ